VRVDRGQGAVKPLEQVVPACPALDRDRHGLDSRSERLKRGRVGHPRSFRVNPVWETTLQMERSSTVGASLFADRAS